MLRKKEKESIYKSSIFRGLERRPLEVNTGGAGSASTVLVGSSLEVEVPGET